MGEETGSQQQRSTRRRAALARMLACSNYGVCTCTRHAEQWGLQALARNARLAAVQADQEHVSKEVKPHPRQLPGRTSQLPKSALMQRRPPPRCSALSLALLPLPPCSVPSAPYPSVPPAPSLVPSPPSPPKTRALRVPPKLPSSHVSRHAATQTASYTKSITLHLLNRKHAAVPLPSPPLTVSCGTLLGSATYTRRGSMDTTTACGRGWDKVDRAQQAAGKPPQGCSCRWRVL